jgi:hypothetical protein
VSFLSRFQETVAAAQAFERNGGPPHPPEREAQKAAERPRSGRPAVYASQLESRRERLRKEIAELQWDLGGLAYEMAIRDHFRMDTLMRQAALMQEKDAELANVEHLLALEDAGAEGRCPGCRSLYARGAVFCARCGTRLMDTTRVEEGRTAGVGRTQAEP